LLPLGRICDVYFEKKAALLKRSFVRGDLRRTYMRPACGPSSPFLRL